jgi:hypothetical protein
LINIRFLLCVVFFGSTEFLRSIPWRFHFLCLSDTCLSLQFRLAVTLPVNSDGKIDTSGLDG